MYTLLPNLSQRQHTNVYRVHMAYNCTYTVYILTFRVLLVYVLSTCVLCTLADCDVTTKMGRNSLDVECSLKTVSVSVK